MTEVAIPNPPQAFNDSSFRGRVFGVTGSAHGIGEATVKELARLGASVVILDIDAKNLKRVEADVRKLTSSALFLRGDVADDDFIRRSIRAAHKRWGRIDGWVNNATYNPGGQPDTLSHRDFERCWRVNVVSAWTAIGLLTPIMKKQGGGSIISISSIMAHLPISRNGAYALNKASLEGMTRSLAVDLAPHHIRVNAIVPGFISTMHKITPEEYPGVPGPVAEKCIALRKRLVDHDWKNGQPWPLQGRARDVADAILFLLSDAARFISGACIPVDGAAGVYRVSISQLDVKSLVRDRAAVHALWKKYPMLGTQHRTRKRTGRVFPRK